ncbi:MAG TPA: shikimate dehydrogenase [Anaerolineae bacterium]|jgi:shikimate dehydrogenase|nr:shikimate dehydrogenase [Anaerolineae bacterium]
MMPVDGQTRLLGIMGWPVEHTLSPAMHNSAFAALGLNWSYLPLPVPPANLQIALSGLVALGFRGANVTVPHKEAVMQHLDATTAAAQAIGAVNTIVVGEDGRMMGDNTDCFGFLASLNEAGFDPRGRRVLVLGAGGAARAVVYALAGSGARVVVLNRTLASAAALVLFLSFAVPAGALSARPLTSDVLAEEAAQADLLVNATTVGMWPDDNSSLWPDTLPFPPSLVACDLVYRPRETKLLHQARQAGALTIEGVEMLVQQGALAFEMWTDHQAPLEVMRSACLRALGDR